MTTPLTDAQILDADAETAELLSAQAQAHAPLADAGRVPGLNAELAAAHKLLAEWQVRVQVAEAALEAGKVLTPALLDSVSPGDLRILYAWAAARQGEADRAKLARTEAEARAVRAEAVVDSLIEESVEWMHSEICGGECGCGEYRTELRKKYRTLKETHHG